MSRERQRIVREIQNREPFISGTVIGRLRIQRFDGTGPGSGVMWVVDVEIGSNRPMLNVPVKASGDGGRFYAQDGAAVLLRRNASGRFQVVGPGDRANAPMVTSEYDLATLQQIGVDSSLGASRVLEPFEFYAGPASLKGNAALTFVEDSFNDIINRTVGSFVTEGFVAAENLRVGKKSVNAGVHVIATVSALQMTMIGGGVFVAEGPLTGVSLIQGTTSRWNNGTDTFPSVRIIDATGNQIFPS